MGGRRELSGGDKHDEYHVYGLADEQHDSRTLGSKLAANESALSGWTFLTSNYTVSATNPIYLSLDVGPGYSSDDFNLWHYDGSVWTNYAPIDLMYDGTYASFTATGLSGYAVSAVPKPGTLVLSCCRIVRGAGLWHSQRGSSRRATGTSCTLNRSSY